MSASVALPVVAAARAVASSTLTMTPRLSRRIADSRAMPVTSESVSISIDSPVRMEVLATSPRASSSWVMSIPKASNIAAALAMAPSDSSPVVAVCTSSTTWP